MNNQIKKEIKHYVFFDDINVSEETMEMLKTYYDFNNKDGGFEFEEYMNAILNDMDPDYTDLYYEELMDGLIAQFSN